MREVVDGLGYVPKTCTWELTLRCNLNCGHCGSRAGRARPGEMPLSTMLRVTRELATMGCRRLTLAGGEPTLSPHWSAVAAEGARLGVKTNMVTNGVGWDRARVRRAKDAGLVSLGVSLDGLEGTHDGNRGCKGLFGQVMRLLDDCAAEGLPVGAVTTIWRGNDRDLGKMHELLAGRVYVWQLQLGAAMGNLRDHRHEQIAPEDLLWLVPEIAGLIRKGGANIQVADNVGYYGPYEEAIRSKRRTPVPCWIGCYAGCRHVGIEADGGVKGCLSIQADRRTEGNLQIDSFADIWHRKGAFAYNRGFRLDDLAGFCRTCEHAAVCRGGCLSMRTCEGGGENPFCYHRVATLAERRVRRSRPRYVPMVLAPAALLAMFGLGCGGNVAVDERNAQGTGGGAQDAGSADVVAADVAAEVDPPIVDHYGIAAEAGDEPPIVDPYGVADAEVDVGTVDDYGIPLDAGDAEPPIVDPYGVADAEADVPNVDYYGIMPDAEVEAEAEPPFADMYGEPSPDP